MFEVIGMFVLLMLVGVIGVGACYLPSKRNSSSSERTIAEYKEWKARNRPWQASPDDVANHNKVDAKEEKYKCWRGTAGMSFAEREKAKKDAAWYRQWKASRGG